MDTCNFENIKLMYIVKPENIDDVKIFSNL